MRQVKRNMSDFRHPPPVGKPRRRAFTRRKLKWHVTWRMFVCLRVLRGIDGGLSLLETGCFLLVLTVCVFGMRWIWHKNVFRREWRSYRTTTVAIHCQIRKWSDSNYFCLSDFHSFWINIPHFYLYYYHTLIVDVFLLLLHSNDEELAIYRDFYQNPSIFCINGHSKCGATLLFQVLS